MCKQFYRRDGAGIIYNDKIEEAWNKRDTTLIWTVHTKQAKSETRKGTRKITGSSKPT